MLKRILPFLLLLILLGGVLFYFSRLGNPKPVSEVQVTKTPTPSPSPSPSLPPLPTQTIIQNDYQVFQTFNNCGPASLSMALSFFGINQSQAQLGQDLRPYQNPQGDNDDKSVSLDELATEAEKFGLLAYSRPHGSLNTLKQFTAQGIPVIIETTLTPDDDIGHYRVVKGFDDSSGWIIQDDSMQGHNIRIPYSQLDAMWKKYDYSYVAIVPKDKQLTAQEILGADLSQANAWQAAADANRSELVKDPSNIDSRFNLSVALFHIGNYSGSVSEFEKVQNRLPFRTLWYQIEPIEAYFELGDYQKVFSLTDQILNGGNRAFSELYIIRGKIYQKQSNLDSARTEFEKAVFYNKNLKSAQDALKSIQP